MTGIEIEFVTKNEFDENDPEYSEFASVFAKFQFPEAEQVIFFFFSSSFFE